MSKYSKFIDRWIHPDFFVGNKNQLRRAREVIGLILILFPIICLYASQHFVNGPVYMGYVLLTLLVLVIFAGWIMWLTKKPIVSSNLVYFAGYLLILTSICVGKGTDSATLIWLAVIPVLSLSHSGETSGKIWLVICTFTVMAFYFLDHFGFQGLGQYSAEQTKMFRVQHVLLISILLFMNLLHHHRNKISAMKELDKKNRQNVQLVRILSHDLATPLTVIENNNKLLIMGNVPSEKIPVCYKRINTSVELIAQILTHVRTIQAAETGKKQIQLVAIDLVLALEDLKQMFSVILDAKKISLKILIESASTVVLAEQGTLTAGVLNNLLSNAIKFSRENSAIEIKISATQNIRGHESIRLSVRDYGIGMPDSIKHNIFSFDKPTSRVGTKGEKGTGFGMPIVKGYLDQYGAEVSIDSRSIEEFPQNHGTEFAIDFLKAA